MCENIDKSEDKNLFFNDNDQTSARNIFNLLRNDPDVRLIFLYQDTKCVDNLKLIKGAQHRLYYYDSSPDDKYSLECDDKNQSNLLYLINQLKFHCKIMLACAWYTEEESRRFKMHPWGVSESSNNEKRSFFMGLNYNSVGASNVHTHLFVQSYQR